MRDSSQKNNWSGTLFQNNSTIDDDDSDFFYFQRAQIWQLGGPATFLLPYNKSCKADMASSIIQLFRNSELSFIMDFCKTISTFLSHNLKLFIYVLI